MASEVISTLTFCREVWLAPSPCAELPFWAVDVVEPVAVLVLWDIL
jgi:hypothetical protein